MKFIVALLVLICMVCGCAWAEKSKISIAASFGTFRPSDSEIRGWFDDTLTRFSFRTFEPDKPTKWRFVTEGGAYRLDGPIDVRLYPVTFGWERGLSEKGNVRPYLSLRAGPYYGSVNETLTGESETKIGLNANAAIGIIFSRNYYAEIRYDYFSEIADRNFDGLSLSVGMRLFDIRL